MGPDPKSSVLNTACQSHDITNLFVGDASVFAAYPQDSQEAIRSSPASVGTMNSIEPEPPIAQISRVVGFRTPSHFSTVFRRLMGVTPHEYRAKRLEGARDERN